MTLIAFNLYDIKINKMKRSILVFLLFFSSIITFDQGNPNNKFDVIGQLHNAIVDNFYATVSLPIKDGKEIVYSIDTYFAKSKPTFSASKFLLADKQLDFARKFEAASDKYSFLIDNKYLSKEATNYYQQMDNLYQISNSSEFISNMIILESNIQNSKIIESEKGILLAAASVARYSSYYWETHSPTGGTSAKFSWGSTGKADLKGAIEGGVAGAIIGGSVATPLGSVPGWVAGAVSWGAGCSVSNAIGQLTGWW